MADPKPLTRNELAKFLPDQRAIRAFEKLFAIVPGDIETLSAAIDEVNVSSGIASEKAQQALDALERIAASVEYITAAIHADIAGRIEALTDSLAMIAVAPVQSTAIGGSGTINKVPKFGSSGAITDSSRTDTGAAVTETLPVTFQSHIKASTTSGTYSAIGNETGSPLSVSDTLDNLVAVKNTAFAVASQTRALTVTNWYNYSSSAIGSVNGFNAFAYHMGSGGLSKTTAPGGLCGGRMGARISTGGTGTVAYMVGVSVTVSNIGAIAVTVTTINGILIEGSSLNGCTSTNYVGLKVSGPSAITGLTNHYGIYVDTIAVGTNRWAFYAQSDPCYFGGITQHNGVVRLRGYTVATLPAGVVGDTCYVTNALAPAWNAVIVGGGAVVTKAFYNGVAWVAQ